MSTIKPIEDLFSSIEGTIQETNALFQQISTNLEGLKEKMIPEQKNQHQAKDSVGFRETEQEEPRDNNSEHPTLRYWLLRVRNILQLSLRGLACSFKSLEIWENPFPMNNSPPTKNSLPKEESEPVRLEISKFNAALSERLENVLYMTELEIASSPFNLRALYSIVLEQKNQKDFIILGDFFGGKREQEYGTKTENQDTWTTERSGIGCIKTESTLYSGEVQGGKKHGIGAQTFDDGVSFRGRWFKGEPAEGLWRLPDGNQLFGQRTLLNGRSLPLHEVMIGLKSERDDPLEDSSCFERVNYLFWDGGKTKLSNLKIPQTLGIEITDSDSDPLIDPLDISIFKSSVEFLNGVIYEGSFKDFNPVNCGILKIPERLFSEANLDFKNFFGKKTDEDYVEYRVITSEDKVLFYSKFIKVPLQIISNGKMLHYVKIEFLNRNCYKGMISDEFDFFGVGTFWNNKDQPLFEKKYVLLPPGGNSVLQFEPKSKLNRELLRILDSSSDEDVNKLFCLNKYFFGSKFSLPIGLTRSFKFKGSSKEENSTGWE